MRDYGKIHVGFWSSGTLAGLDSDARLLAVYLMTSSHTTMIGAFRLPDAYACEDLGWTPERFRNGLETLSKAGFIKYDAEHKFVWVINFTKWNKPDNPNQLKAMVKLVLALPIGLSFRVELMFALGVSETVSEPLGNTPVPVPVPVPVSEGGEKPKLTIVGESVAIPLIDGTEYVVSQAEISELRAAYPRVDVLAELRKARAWALANQPNRKTRRGCMKFLTGWVGRAAPTAPETIDRAALPGGGRRAL